MPVSHPVTHDELVERYADRIDYLGAGGCWIWQGQINNWGYGMAVGFTRQKKQAAHRVIYECLVGPIPEGLVLDHTCRNHACVNPAHLQPITQSENVGLGRLRKTHCPQGHPYSGDNLRFSRQGHRICRTCDRERCRAYQAKIAAKKESQ